MSDLMEKIGALLMKAESTDNEHERDAFMSKAQQLATVAAIDLEVARTRQKDKHKRETPTMQTIRLFDYADRSTTKAFFVNLMLAIGRENDLRFTIAHNSTYINAYGFPSDIDVTEALYNSLSVQMVAAAERYLKTGEYKKETVQYEVNNGWWGSDVVTKPMHGKTARRSFYTAFTSEIGARLHEAREVAAEATVTTDDGETSGALVLASKYDEVSEYYRDNNNARGSYRGGGYESRGRGAQSAGRQAGASARLGGGGSLAGKRGSIGA